MKYLFKKLTAVSLVCSLSMTAVFARPSANITKSKAETLTFTETAFTTIQAAVTGETDSSGIFSVIYFLLYGQQIIFP